MQPWLCTRCLPWLWNSRQYFLETWQGVCGSLVIRLPLINCSTISGMINDETIINVWEEKMERRVRKREVCSVRSHDSWRGSISL